jgi:translation initiation factor 3 subunit M
LFPKPIQIQELVSYLDRLQFGETPKDAARTTDYRKLVEDLSYLDVLQKLSDEEELVLEKGNKGEIECFFSILNTLVLKFGGPNTQKLVAKSIDFLTKEKRSKKVERLSTLSHMYNLFQDPNLRHMLFVAILEYSLETEQTAAVEGQFDTIETRLKELNLNNSQKRKIFELILKHMRDWRSSFAYDYWVKLFSTYDPDEPVSEETKSDAQSAILALIKDSEIIRTDLLFETHVVKSLQDHHQFGTVYQLLQIFTEFGYTEFVLFWKKNFGVLEKLGLNQSDLVNKIRMLTLLSLASTKDEFSFKEVANLLDIDESEVEQLVVEAVISDVIDARIDQLQQRVVVRRAESRILREEEWERLDKKLDKWKENMNNLLKVVQHAKGIAAGK